MMWKLRRLYLQSSNSKCQVPSLLGCYYVATVTCNWP